MVVDHCTGMDRSQGPLHVTMTQINFHRRRKDRTCEKEVLKSDKNHVIYNNYAKVLLYDEKPMRIQKPFDVFYAFLLTGIPKLAITY